MQSIRSLMQHNYLLSELRLTNALESRSIGAVAGGLACAAITLASGAFPSCQCLLFCDPQNHREIANQLLQSSPDVLYCDGIRTFFLLKHLRHLHGRMKIVVDLDDLMSRRMAALAESKAALSFGYLQDKASSHLSRMLAFGPLSQAIVRYEKLALTTVEDEISRWADAITLVSSSESELLRRRISATGSKAAVHTILPPVAIKQAPRRYDDFSHFFFIGTDTLVQNRLTIERLVDLWANHRPGAPLFIFGHMTRRWPQVKGITFRGYVPSLEAVYSESGVLLSPGVLRGGVKTKVAEAFAYGCAVIGNDITFEGMDLPDYPLLASQEEQLAHIILAPADHRNAFRRAATLGQEFVLASMNPSRFEEAWKNILS